MPKNFSDLQDAVATVLTTGMRQGDPMRTQIAGWINQSCRRIAYAYPWDQRRGEQRITTVDTYATGTVAVTKGSTGITFTGATLTDGMVGRKFSLGVGQPYYRIASVNTGAGTAVLAEAYTEATATGATYVIYQDEYDLAVTTHSVEAAAILVSGRWNPMPHFQQRNFESIVMGTSTGTPSAWGVCTSTTVGTMRVIVSPVPDDTYRISFRYLKTWTDMAGPNDLYTASLPVDVEELIVERALRWAPRIEGSRYPMSDDRFRRELGLVWASHRKSRDAIGTRQSIINTTITHGVVADTDSLAL